MKKLSSIRDGTFFYVEKYEKIAEYFGIVLGSCVSVVSNKASLVVELLNKKCEIKKIFGEEYLYSYEIKPYYFTTTMLHFIYGKEFTYVLEFEIKLNEVNIGEDLLSVNFIYQDNENNFHIKNVIYKYCLTDINHSKANEEYIRSQVYFVIDKSLKLKENNNNYEAKKVLEEMKEWLIENNKKNKQNNLFLNDINQALNFYNNDFEYKKKGIAKMSSNVMENIKKSSSEPKSDYITFSQKLYSSSSRVLMNREPLQIKKYKKKIV